MILSALACIPENVALPCRHLVSLLSLAIHLSFSLSHPPLSHSLCPPHQKKPEIACERQRERYPGKKQLISPLFYSLIGYRSLVWSRTKKILLHYSATEELWKKTLRDISVCILRHLNSLFPGGQSVYLTKNRERMIKDGVFCCNWIVWLIFTIYIKLISPSGRNLLQGFSSMQR